MMPAVRNRTSGRALAAGFTVLALALVGVAAWALAHNQSHQRRDLRDRYVDRTAVASSLVDSLFRVAFTSQARDASQRFAGKVTPARLDAQVARGQQTYALVLDRSGRVVGASKRAPLGRTGLPPAARAALRSGFGLGDASAGTLESAVAFPTPHGQRVLIQGQPVKVYSDFLAGTLRPLTTLKGSEALVLDGRGHVVGGITHDGRRPVARPALIGATRRSQGTYGDVFVGSQRLPTTPWKGVVTAPQSELYASVSGPGTWVPWVILGVGALALLAIGLLLWRVTRTSDMLRDANAELDASRRGLEERARELERSNADLEQFACAASHALSEPLRTVAGFSQLLQSRYAGRLDPDADEYIGHMATGVNRMQELIDDLLLYSRVGRAPLRQDDVDLEAVFGDVLEWMAPAVTESGARITHDPLPIVRGERGQLAQVLQNLLANAVKFTAPGTVPAVHVSAEREGGAGWRMSVRDNGIGVETADEQIFKMFGRLHGPDSYPGTGIGLALAKRIVEAHGGRIWVEPAPGGGSVFSFTLPAGARVREREAA